MDFIFDSIGEKIVNDIGFSVEDISEPLLFSTSVGLILSGFMCYLNKT